MARQDALEIALAGPPRRAGKGRPVLDFLKRQVVTPLPEAVRSSLSQERNVSAEASQALKMVQERGLYSGRKVTYFRVFNPVSLASPPRAFADVEGAGLLYAGHIEPEGHVVLSR